MKKSTILKGLTAAITGLTLPMFALSPIQSKYWILNDARINFAGTNPVFEGQVGNLGANKISSSTHGVYDAQGNTLFKLLKDASGAYTVYKYYNSTLLNLTTSTETINGQVNIVPLRCSSQANKYLIVYYKINTAQSCLNTLEYRVYDYAAHTLSSPIVLETGLCTSGEMALSRENYQAYSQDRYLYYTKGKAVRRALINVSATTNAAYITTASIVNVKMYITYSPNPVEMELSHDGTKLSWIDYGDNNIRIIHLNNANAEQVITSTVPQTTMIWTGLEFSPDGNKLLVNRYVKTSPSLSSTACVNIAAGTVQHVLHNPTFSHSQIELAYDGLVYATDGKDLLGMDANTGNVVKTVAIAYSNTTANYPHFAFNDNAAAADYGAPQGHQIYRIPDMIDGEVYMPNMANNGQISLNLLYGRVCGPNDVVELPDDIAFADVALYKTTSNAMIGNAVIPGNTKIRLTETFPALICSSVDTTKYYMVFAVQKKSCGAYQNIYSAQFWVTCTDRPVISYNATTLCLQSTTLVSLTNPPPAGVTINWYVHNPNNTLLTSLTNQTQVNLPAGRYSAQYVQSNCYISNIPQDIACPQVDPVDPLDPRSGRVAAEESASLKVYPVPTSGLLYLSNSENLQKVEVLSTTGRHLKTIDDHMAEIDLGDLEDGMYLLHLTDQKGASKTEKIKIQH